MRSIPDPQLDGEPAPPAQDLTIHAWYSAAGHGQVGEVLLEVPDDGTFGEPRAGGVTRLVIDFSKPIAPSSFTEASIVIVGNGADGLPVDLSGLGTATSTARSDTVGVIDFASALPDSARYLVRLEGVTDAAGDPLSGDSDRIFTALSGDANGDLRVDAIDLSYVWAHRTAGIDDVSVDQVRADVNGDGRVNAMDLSSIWAGRGRNMQDVSDPQALAVPADAGAAIGLSGAEAEGLWATPPGSSASGDTLASDAAETALPLASPTAEAIAAEGTLPGVSGPTDVLAAAGAWEQEAAAAASEQYVQRPAGYDVLSMRVLETQKNSLLPGVLCDVLAEGH